MISKNKKSLSRLQPWEEGANRSKSSKEIGKSIHGSPDEWDYENLEALINIYNKTYPGRLNNMLNDYKVERALTTRDKYGIVAKESDTRLTMWMPADLKQVIEAGYPSIWTDKKHYFWFLKRFPIFQGSEKL